MLSVDVVRRQSDLTHQGASAVFDLAERQPVLIKRREGADAVLLNAESYEALRRLNRGLNLLARALVKGPERMPDLEGLHWTKLFVVEERRTMLLELAEAARASLERDDPTILNAAWKGWECSGEVLDDPARLKALIAPIDPDTTVALQRPVG